MRNLAVYVKMYEGMGRGVATNNNLGAGSLIMQCELLVLSQKDTTIVNVTDLEHYTFKYDDSRDCLVLGDGEIFNHSDTPNVEYRLEDFTQDGVTRKVMVFYATRGIAAGEQLFIDYNADTKVSVDGYINQASLIGT